MSGNTLALCMHCLTFRCFNDECKAAKRHFKRSFHQNGVNPWHTRMATKYTVGDTCPAHLNLPSNPSAQGIQPGLTVLRKTAVLNALNGHMRCRKSSQVVRKLRFQHPNIATLLICNTTIYQVVRREYSARHPACANFIRCAGGQND